MNLLGEASWQSPSNIALIKYWGKHGRQLPQNPSLSLTLNKCVTKTSLKLFSTEEKDPELNLFFEEKRNEKFEARVQNYLSSIDDILPWVNYKKFVMETKNTFPHSSGIASSASSMSALALCLQELDQHITGKKEAFYQRASFLARLASGSASRSLFGGFAFWGQSSAFSSACDDFAVPFYDFHPIFSGLKDAILIVSSAEKKVSSTVGHSQMNGHPFREARYLWAKDHSSDLIQAMKAGDWSSFAEVVESEALCLHALMMTASPSTLLLSANSLAIIEKIKNFRANNKASLCFTIDAGPNVHVLYPANESFQVEKFISEELAVLCEEQKIIWDEMGEGPIKKDKKT